MSEGDRSSSGADGRRLLFCIVKEHRHLDMLLAGMVEMGIADASVMPVESMGQILSTDVPIFAGLGSLFAASSGERYLVFCSVPSEDVIEIYALIEDVCGPWGRVQSAVAWSIDIASFRGVG
ncbi:MAG: hypothetical protein J7M25_04500 [Deltaproteobacteria bacterium]|nr:hypothetical protein [Deltaproteobacteria bacterium]